MNLRDSVIETLRGWDPPDPAQDALRAAVLAFVLARPDACRRDCEPGHITASTLVLDDTGAHMLLTLHPRIGRWLQLGGHCEPTDSDIVAAAEREATEESGIAGLAVEPELAAIHVHPVTCSLGKPTRHLDLQFVAHAPPGAQIACSGESLDLRWWPVDEPPADADFALLELTARAKQSRVRRRSSSESRRRG